MGTVPARMIDLMLTDWLQPTRPSLTACAARALAQPDCPAGITREGLRSALRRAVARLAPATVIVSQGGSLNPAECIIENLRSIGLSEREWEVVFRLALVVKLAGGDAISHAFSDLATRQGGGA